MRTPIKCTLSAAALACLAVPPSQAAEDWQWLPKIQLGYIYDDNYRLDLPGSEVDVSGGLLDAQLQLLGEGELTTWSLTPRIRTDYFPDERDEESDDYYLTYDFNHKTQRFEADMSARYADESVVRSELPGIDPDAGLGGEIGGDAGRVSVRNRRELIEFTPQLKYALSERRGVQGGAFYRDVQFRDSVVEQVGYSEFGLNGGFSFAQSQRTTLTLQALANWYDPEAGTNEASNYGGQAEWSTSATENTRTYIRIGALRNTIDRTTLTGVEERNETGYLAGLGGQWTGQLYSALIDLSRNIGPTASGFVVERDQIRFRVTRRFSERAGMFFGVRGIRDNALESDVDYQERMYANGNVGFEWRMSRQLSVSANYDYTWQEFDDEPEARNSSGVSLSLVYEPKRRD